jgi:hypothetical protein
MGPSPAPAWLKTFSPVGGAEQTRPVTLLRCPSSIPRPVLPPSMSDPLKDLTRGM